MRAIELALNRLAIIKYLNGMAFVYFVLEYFHTLELEVGQLDISLARAPQAVADGSIPVYSQVAYVWGEKLSTVNVLFFVTRYLGFFANGLLMWFFGPSPSSGVEVCRKLYWVTLFVIAVTLTAADAIVCVRIHALSRRSRTMAIILSIHFMAASVGFFSLLGLDIKMTTLAESPFPPHLTCFILDRNHIRGILLLALVLYNTVCAYLF
ncbi:hypothetical protein EST38_g10077 [Candolleomyces aberdarensis]|uniref:Uncharacterized protein n=1 Tax=Candolleomyces aberdarensis TaxID=2316362 RepID=A0A4Q2DAQ8_9AGAR|nr:hypothetical protein EST38_g10077 [Candolleomyces aberdarensis]